MQPKRFAITITFRQCPSARYATALNLARSFESYREEDDAGTLTHSVCLSDELKLHDLFARFISLIRLVGPWKDTILTVSGEVVPLSTVERVVQVGECYQRQRRSGNPYHYCNGFDPRHAPTHFGCRLLTEVNRYIPQNGEQRQSEKAWYRYGQMNSSSFRVDKQKILAVLMEEADSKLAHVCPVFNPAAIAEEVVALPEEIDLQSDGKWIPEFRPDGTVGIRMRTLADRRRVHEQNADRHGNGGSDGDHGRGNGHVGPASDDELAAEPEERVIPSVRFSDVGGQDRAVSEVRDWVELPLVHPELFAHVGVPTQVGVILYGPPGTGKTLLAQAVAGECQAHLEVVSGPEILSKWVGQSEENLRRIFDCARRMAPSVILLDEIDAIAPARDRSVHRHEVTLVSQLLTLMDGLYDRGQVVVIATTNRLESVDPALRRPGRFDYAIQMELPDVTGRKAIFERHLKRMAVSDAVDALWLAEVTVGFSGADIAKVCRQAGMLCVKEAIRRGYHTLESVRIEPENLLAALGGFGRGPLAPVAQEGS